MLQSATGQQDRFDFLQVPKYGSPDRFSYF